MTLCVKFDVAGYLDQFSGAAAACGFAKEVITRVGEFEIPAFTRRAAGQIGAAGQLGETGGATIYLSSGMHGDEPAGPWAMLQMMEEQRFHKDIEWQVCPVINPAGLASGTRENADGVDLNRDYLRKATQEVSEHVTWLDQQPVPDVFLSLHEDWESSGFYLYEIQKCVCASVAHSVLTAAAEEIEPEPDHLIDGHEVREPGWIFHEPRADFPGDWPEAIYMAERGTEVSYTLETPSSLELKKRVACHKLAVCKAVEEFLLTRGA